MWGLLLDGVVAALLLLTIVTALVLNRRLGSLNREKATLQALVNDLAEMSSRAESAVSSLRVTAEHSGRNLLQCVERADKLSTDLHFVIDRGNSVADRLDETLRTARAEIRTDASPPRAADHATVERPAPERSAMERSAMERSGEKPAPRGERKGADPRSAARMADRAAELEDRPMRPRRAAAGTNRSATILGQLYGEGILDEGAEAADEVASRAERDLLRALDGRR